MIVHRISGECLVKLAATRKSKASHVVFCYIKNGRHCKVAKRWIKLWVVLCSLTSWCPITEKWKLTGMFNESKSTLLHACQPWRLCLVNVTIIFFAWSNGSVCTVILKDLGWKLDKPMRSLILPSGYFMWDVPTSPLSPPPFAFKHTHFGREMEAIFKEHQ